jgi:hypothetical protein
MAAHSAQLLGKSYLTSGSPAASRAISELLGPYVHSPIATDAFKTACSLALMAVVVFSTASLMPLIAPVAFSTAS